MRRKKSSANTSKIRAKKRLSSARLKTTRFSRRADINRNIMSAQDKDKIIDPSAINIIDHLLIRDKATGKVIVNKRDTIQVIKNDDKR